MRTNWNSSKTIWGKEHVALKGLPHPRLLDEMEPREKQQSLAEFFYDPATRLCSQGYIREREKQGTITLGKGKPITGNWKGRTISQGDLSTEAKIKEPLHYVKRKLKAKGRSARR